MKQTFVYDFSHEDTEFSESYFTKQDFKNLNKIGYDARHLLMKRNGNYIMCTVSGIAHIVNARDCCEDYLRNAKNKKSKFCRKLNDTYGKILDLGVRYYTNIGYFEYSKNL